MLLSTIKESANQLSKYSKELLEKLSQISSIDELLKYISGEILYNSDFSSGANRQIAKDIITRKFVELIKTDKDASDLLESSSVSMLTKDIKNSEVFIDYVKSNVSIDPNSGLMSVRTHDGKNKTSLAYSIVRTLYTALPEILENLIKQQLDSLKPFSVKMNESALTRAEKQFYFTLFKVSDIKSSTLLISLLYLARQLYSEFDDETLIEKIKKHPAFRKFENSAIKEIGKVLTITEHDIYNEYTLLLANTTLASVCSSIKDLALMTSEAEDLGKKAFNWLYSLVDHGSMHEQKKKLLTNYQNALQNSPAMKLADLDFFPYTTNEQINQFYTE
jgi:hypothetical protein